MEARGNEVTFTSTSGWGGGPATIQTRPGSPSRHTTPPAGPHKAFLKSTKSLLHPWCVFSSSTFKFFYTDPGLSNGFDCNTW